MTLDEMLALLPDNSTGEISPADLRSIVTDLYHAAHSASDAYAYRWSATGPPGSGHVTMDQPWQIFASKALISETTDDGMTPSFGAIDSANAARVWFTAATGEQLVADVTGPSVDMGAYRQVPIAVQSITGNQPANNAAVTVSLVVVM